MPPQPQPMSRTLSGPGRSSFSLAAICRFLAACACFQRFIAARKIGAGILPVTVQEQRIEPAVQIVMMRDVPARAHRVVGLKNAAAAGSRASRVFQLQHRHIMPDIVATFSISRLQHVMDAAIYRNNALVHIGFAEAQSAGLARASLRSVASVLISKRPPGAFAAVAVNRLRSVRPAHGEFPGPNSG